MRFELHCHTKHSVAGAPLDCMEEPIDVVRWAKRIGLDGIAITDHDTINGWKTARTESRNQGLVFIPGIEISSRDGHILGLGVSDRIDAGLGIEETVDRIHDAGGIAVSAHPFDIRGHGAKELLVKADAVEAFNALSIDRFSNMITERKADDHGMPKVSGSDAHTLGMIGRASINARAYDMDSMIREIRKGRATMGKRYVNLSEIKEWSRMRMIEAYIDMLQYIDQRYGRYRAWAFKHLMKRFVLSTNPIWDVAARASLAGAMSVSLIKTIAYY